MKKNAMLKIAAILMVAVLLTTCAISSTFAKYVTAGNPTEDSARVAKWGVEITTDVTGLFLDTYDVNESGATVGGNEVFVAEGTDLVAPGTANKVNLNTSVSGTPEVSVKVSTEATVTLNGWSVVLTQGAQAVEYLPIIFKVNGTEYKAADYPATAEKTSAELLAAAVKEAIEAAGTKEFVANTDLAAATAADVLIEWRWDFSTSAENDVKDTLLGNAGTATVTVKLTQKVEQTDTTAATEATQASGENA